MKKIPIILLIVTFIFILIMDCINITQYFDYAEHIDSAISNTITFISILIGFISSTYIMIQQNQNSCVLKLIRDNGLIITFNKSFKILMYIGFINVFLLILTNFIASNIYILKVMAYIVVPLSVDFLAYSADYIIIICKMIIKEEYLKLQVKELKEEDVK